jgi:putative PEP-CTERM system histidine kinase
MELELINDAALILGGLMMLVSLSRMRSMDIKFYMSDTLIYNSLSILFIGAYFIAVGILAKFSFWIGDGHELAFRAFFILLAFAGLISLFLSDRLKKRLKQFVSRHLKRPLYDYRQEWTKFTHNTTLVMDIEKLGDIVVRMVAKTFNVLSVTIWTLDESEKNVKMIASTVFPPSEKSDLESQKRLLEFILAIKHKNIAHDIDFMEDELSSLFRDFDHKFFEKLRIRYCIPLKAGGNFMGIMALYNRIGDYRFNLEDFDLLKTMADQLASSMLNIMLAQDLRKAKQMEAFQRLSAFFVHDLKNLASNLSLTIKNLPKHFDNPEFRKDTLKSLSQGVDKIGSMCSKLTSLSQKTDLDMQSTDLNVIVSKVISNVNGSFGQKITKTLESLPQINLDPEQFQKVITNLILNAHEATNKEGNVYITTKHENGWVILTVQDNGKGMEKDFMESSLFQPFKTTKEKGMGIGLYHSLSIVEAHHGKIEVESQLGKGCTFKVFLPVKSE